MTDEASGSGRPAGRRLGQLATLPVETLRGVGPRKAAALGAMGIETVFDLLTHYPRRYADRTTAVAIGALEPGVEGVISGQIRRVDVRRPRGRAAIVTVVIDDETGRLTIRFFNQPWRARQLGEGMGVVVFGRVDAYRGELQMVNPIVDLVGDRTGRIVPIYPQSEKAGVGSNELATYIAEALERAGDFAEPLAPDALARFGLIERTDAFRSIHLPERSDAWLAARRRLAFDELFRLQLSLVLRRRAVEATARGIVHPVVKALAGGLVNQFIAQLPFPLTTAQSRVIREVASDLAAPLPMHRLLQGDVGSGKTVVALAALLFAVDGDRQGALMVPTEVLAEQHFLLARGLVAGMAIPDPDRLGGSRPPEIALLTSRTPQARRARLLSRLRTGQIDILVGTHALLTEDVAFRALGVVVIDEQHRFGVDQRATLREKGTADGAPVDPDVLVMTATPIPRTAAMTVYGDLDQSTLDELPAGRAQTATVVLADEEEDRAWSALLAEVAEGHQAFVICPLVRPGASEATDASEGPAGDTDPTLFLEPDDRPRRPPRNAVDELERLTAGPLASVRVGLLHGQLAPKEKERAMEAFRRGELDVLVATTVIEVGVDVPNATVVVIEDADRFGIAQLHQLRGRVGRGVAPARCFLLTDRPTDDGERRLAALAATTDGFELAEVDLELRGEGTVLGIRQKGRSDLRLASLRNDRDLVVAARTVATTVIDADPDLTDHPLLAEELDRLLGEDAAYLHRN